MDRIDRPKVPAAGMLHLAENLIISRNTCCPGWREGDTILTYIVFTALANHANRYWLTQPIEFKFKDGMTLNEFNAQLPASTMVIANE